MAYLSAHTCLLTGIRTQPTGFRSYLESLRAKLMRIMPGKYETVQMTDDQKRDRYYKKKYGVDLGWYNAKLAEQGNACGICRRPQELFTKRFAIDHDHGHKRLKISYQAIGRGILAFVTYRGQVYDFVGRNKREAARGLKAKLKAASCRGLLCPFCNRGLRYYADDPVRLANAAEYLKRHKGQ